MMPSAAWVCSQKKAGAGGDERAVRGLLGLRARDADRSRYLPCLAVHEDDQVGVDVKQGLLGGLAADLIDGLSGRRRGGAGQRRGGGDRDASGSGCTWGGRGLEGAERARLTPDVAPLVAPLVVRTAPHHPQGLE